MHLEDSAKRIRGEIFFARKWILAEGQSDFVLLNAMARLVIGDLDSHAVAVIDCQNNGPAGAFASLARTFGFPWAVLCDGDEGGNRFVGYLKAEEFSDAFLGRIVTRFAKGAALEEGLAASLPDDLIGELLGRIGAAPQGGKATKAEAITAMRKHKMMTALTIREMIVEKKITKQHVPGEIAKVLEYIKTATAYR
jgi:putative ATP-dependent endonuclease of OLD family